MFNSSLKINALNNLGEESLNGLNRDAKLVAHRPDVSCAGHTHPIAANGKNVMTHDLASLTPMG